MRALVLGGTGMLGSAIASHWRRRGQAVLALSRAQADLRDLERLLYWVERYQPELVINCAAFTQVDRCEEERELAMEVNGRAVANAVAAAERVGARLVHVSSDYVFDGRGDSPYLEDAPTGPVSVYGESKLAGEREALVYAKALVLRASWLFGPGGPNFVLTMRRLILAGKTPLRVVHDQIGCPTYTPYLARAIDELASSGSTGLLHYRNRGVTSWHGFATEIAYRMHREGGFLSPEEVIAIPTSEFPRPAPRPSYSVLSIDAFEEAVGRRAESWQAGLAAYLDRLGGNHS